jgi:hypothetical protein
MNLLIYVLGAVYQNTYRQMAALNDLITEAEALNEYMRTLHRVYFDFAANTVNYDSAHVGMVQEVTPALLKFYKDAGLTFPLNRICEGIIPRIYASISDAKGNTQYKWRLFFADKNTAGNGGDAIPAKATDIKTWDNYDYGSGTAHKSPPSYNLKDFKGTDIYKTINKDVDSMNKIATCGQEYELKSVRVSGDGDGQKTFYATCYFDSTSDSDMHYSNFFGAVKSNADLTLPQQVECIDATKKVRVSDISASLTVPIEDVISGKKKGYIVQREMNAFLDQIRCQMDQLNNELQSVETMVGTYNQDMQQNYGVATSAIEVSEETQKRTTRNIR